MPAYFSINFELNKSKTVVRDFYSALVGAGFAFKSGLWEFQNSSFEDIVAWNQKLIDDCHKLANNYNYAYDFQQIEFDFADFSKIRVLMNANEKYSSFVVELIIPEDDFVEWTKEDDDYIPHKKLEKMDLLKEAAKKIWNSLEILAIQTAWELSDYNTPEANLISNIIYSPFSL